MKEEFKRINFGEEKLKMIAYCDGIIGLYQGQGLRLTLRQLYYQLVTRNLIKNLERSYKNLGKLVSDARLAGHLDWDAIEDRVRVPRLPQEFENLGALVDAALYSYRLPRWHGQESYVELWVEKDALSGVLAPIATEYHVTLMVNRGYSSQSAMYEAAKRFDEHRKQQCILLYLGDHDPSGEDMVRDIADRLEMLCLWSGPGVTKIALTMDQVEEYNPPPNPAKMSDSRAAGYVEKHGNESWEVDALPPEVLRDLITDSITKYLDTDAMDSVKAQEEADKKKLRGFVKGMK